MTDEKLLSEVKNYLDITWDDTATDKKVARIVDSGVRKIVKLVGCRPASVKKDGEEKDLLFEYCRLAWAGVPEKFEEIFKANIVGMRLENVTKEIADE